MSELDLQDPRQDARAQGADQPRPAGSGPRSGPGSGPATGPDEHAIEFTASGSEYFRIWIVNLALTVVTLGIYSAWAKVRRLKYFYRSTQVAGSVFDYHGWPLAILKGRLIALVLVAGWYGLGYFSPAVAIVVLLGIAGLMPFLIQRSFRFRLYQSSYRGIRFRFSGALGSAYRVVLVPIAFFLVPGFLGMMYGPGTTDGMPDPWLGLLAATASLVAAALVPRFHHAFKRYQHDHAAFGTTRGAFNVGVRAFYAIYARAWGLGPAAAGRHRCGEPHRRDGHGGLRGGGRCRRCRRRDVHAAVRRPVLRRGAHGHGAVHGTFAEYGVERHHAG